MNRWELKGVSPLMAFDGIAAFLLGEFMTYRGGPGTEFFEVFGFFLLCVAVYFYWRNSMYYSLVGQEEIAPTMCIALLVGALALGLSYFHIPYGPYITNPLAMFSLAHLTVALWFIVLAGFDRGWWLNGQYLTRNTPIAISLAWLMVVALGFLSGVAVPLMSSVGKFFLPIRWWTLPVVPLVWLFRWWYNEDQWKRERRRRVG